MSVIPESQEVQFERNGKLFRLLTDRIHLFLVDLRIADIMDHVRVRHIRKAARFHRLDHLVTVALQRLVRGKRCKYHHITNLISKVVLSQNIVFDRILRSQRQQFIKIGRIILYFQTQMDFDVLFVFLFECQYDVYVILQLIRQHFCMIDIAVRINLRRMIRKSQNFQSSANRCLHVFPLCSACMVTPPRVCMIICDHFFILLL